MTRLRDNRNIEDHNSRHNSWEVGHEQHRPLLEITEAELRRLSNVKFRDVLEVEEFPRYIWPSIFELEDAAEAAKLNNKRAASPGAEGAGPSKGSKIQKIDGSKRQHIAPGEVEKVTFSPFLDITFYQDQLLSLSLFTRAALKYLAHGSPPTVKKSYRQGNELVTSQILDIDKILVKFGSEENLDFIPWMEAANNFIVFIRDNIDAETKDGVIGSLTADYKALVLFFVQKPDSHTLYHLWKKEFREERAKIAHGSFLSQVRLNDAWNRVLTIAEGERTTNVLRAENEALRAEFMAMARQNNFRASDSKQRSNTDRSAPKNDYSKGSNSFRGDRAPACLVCAGPHKLDAHTNSDANRRFPDGKAVASSFSNNALRNLRGEQICIAYNCNPRYHPEPCPLNLKHSCSWCGANHGALTWSCRNKPL